MNHPQALHLEGARLADLQAVVDRLGTTLAATAVQRDAAGGHAAAERQAMRDSGLLGLSLPTALGGWGADWPTVLNVVRQLARVDSALAHVLAFHHLQLATLDLYGNPAQCQRLWQQTAARGWFWGNALNPLDTRLVATPAPGGWWLQGVKGYASGSVGADWLTVSAVDADSQTLLVGVLPATVAGLHVQADWDAFGQRQTDSGSVRFEQVWLPQADVLLPPGTAPSVRGSLRTGLAQLVLVNLYLGLAEGALVQARARLLAQPKAWPGAGVASALEDPVVQHRFGQLHLQLRPAQVLADEAARGWQSAWLAEAVNAERRGAVAIAVSEAKVLAHRAALGVTSEVFELLGASATSQRLGLDRFWRNARVHTLHDPVDIKLREIGRHALTGAWPEPGSYA